ncbi:DUF3303 family protein [Mycobacterium sp. E1747]|uniref:DUF3303 family protein n=1 Tax=Mycobacterium sp. E1747 TaxID=1834128 RepID=UPI000A9B8BD3|nr:DUF3303 family protein [Mycobacterium sp. E1747]
MLFIGFVTIDSHDRPRPEVAAKAHKWWNENERPSGLNILAAYGAVGTSTPDVLVFEAADNYDIQKMVDFWAPVAIDVHPAIDLLEHWRAHGMDVPRQAS